MDAAEGEVGLAGDRLHLLQLGREVERQHVVARRLVSPAVVDRLCNPRFLQRDRRIGHHGGAFRDVSKYSFACGIEVVDDLDVEAVLLGGDDGVGERLFVGQRHKAFIRPGGGHCWSRARWRGLLSALSRNRLLAIRRPAQSRIRTRPASAWWICCIAAAPLRGRRGRSGRTRHRAEQRVPSRRRRVGDEARPARWAVDAHALSSRSVSTISTTSATVSSRAQSRWSSTASATQVTGCAPAWRTRSMPAR